MVDDQSLASLLRVYAQPVKELFRVQRHEDLSVLELKALGELFDGEYLGEHGRWTPDAPYGYSPANVHVLGFRGPFLIAHVGFQPRVIAVGTNDVLVAGTGGVLVDHRFRGTGLGSRAMRHAQKAMRDEAGVDFGFLGCREEVVPFYEATGWYQVHATERCVSHVDQASVIVSQGGPALVCSAIRDARQWPHGDIDLHGTPW